MAQIPPIEHQASSESEAQSIEPPFALLPNNIHGRMSMKRELMARLLARDERTILVLHGIAGGGKSTMALWLARQAVDQGRDIYWIRNSNVPQFMQEIAARRGADPDQLKKFGPDLVWRLLDESAKPWLLVFDNIDDVRRAGVLGGSGEQLDGTGWIRPSAAGLVVVTTRRGDGRVWARDEGRAVLNRVECLADEDGATMLRELAPDAGSTEDAGLLAQTLGGLPLALRLAGSYLRSDPPSHQTFAAYRDVIERDLGYLDIAEPTPARLEDEESARRSIQLTWELSLTLLEQRNLMPARPLLRLLTCYGAPNPIRIELLDAGTLRGSPVDCGKSELTDAYLSQVVMNLRTSALVDQITVSGPDGETINCLSLHPLLAEVVATSRDASPDADTVWAVAVELLGRLSPGPGEPGWATLPALHTAILEGLPPQDAETLARAVLSGDACAGHLLRTGALQASHSMSALTLNRATALAPAHPARLNARLTMAAVNNTTGGMAAAREELITLVGDAGEVMAPGSPFMISARQQLAHTLWSTGFHDEAAAMYSELFADHDDGADERIVTLFGYGQMMSVRGRYEEAEQAIDEVLAAKRADLGENPDHPELLLIRTILADIWLGQGRLPEARDELRLILSAQERVHGPDNPLTLTARMTLMTVLSMMSDEGGAQVQLTQVLRIQRDALNPEHPLALLGMAVLINVRAAHPDSDPRVDTRRLNEVAATMADTLGETSPMVTSIRVNAAVRQHEFDEAGAVRALAALCDELTDEYGPENFSTLSTRLVFTQMLVQGDEDSPRAEAELRELLDAQLRGLGPDHPQTALVCASLATITFRNGDLAGSEEFLRQSLATLQRVHGPDHEDTRQTRATLVQVLAELDRYDDAERELLDLIGAMDRTDPNSDDTLGAHLMLALVRWQAGRRAEAVRDLRRLLATLESLGGHDEDILIVRWILSEALADEGNHEEAEELMRAVVADAAGRADIGLIRLGLGELLHDRGKLAEAEQQLQLAMRELTAAEADEDSAVDADDVDRARRVLSAVGAELQALPPAVVEPTPVPEPPAPEPRPADPWLDYLKGTAEPPEALARREVRQLVEPPAPREVVPRPAPEPPVEHPQAAELWARREQCTTHQEDTRLFTALADLLARRDLSEHQRLHVRRLYALALADRGFPAAAYAHLCVNVACHQRLYPDASRLAHRVDAAMARPDSGGEDVPTALARLVCEATDELGPEHDLTLRVRRGQAELYLARGDVDRAIPELTAALASRTPPSPERAMLRHDLALAAHRRGDLAAAEGLHGQALDELSVLFTADHPRVLLARTALAAVRRTAGQPGALSELRAVLAAQLRRRGPNHPDVATTRHQLGLAAGSRAELELATAIRTRRLGPEHPATRESRAALLTSAGGTAS